MSKAEAARDDTPGAQWLHSHFQKLCTIWEQHQSELKRLADSNLQWMKGRVASERVEKEQGITSAADSTKTNSVKKRGRRKRASENKENEAQTVPESTRKTRAEKQPKSAKPRASDATAIKTAEPLLPKPEQATPVQRQSLRSGDIQSGRFSARKKSTSSISIVIPSAKRPNTGPSKPKTVGGGVGVGEVMGKTKGETEAVVEKTEAIAEEAEAVVVSQVIEDSVGTEPWVTVSHCEPSMTSVAPSPKGATRALLPADELPKVDSWTAQFLKPSAPVAAAPLQAETPFSKRVAPPQSTARKRKAGLRLVEAPIPPVATRPALGLGPAGPKLASLLAPIVNDALPEESPLTKAKRLDSEYAQREQKLKAFLATGSDDLKSRIEGLRGPAKGPMAAEKKALDIAKLQSRPVLAPVEKPSDILKALAERQPDVESEEPIADADTDAVTTATTGHAAEPVEPAALCPDSIIHETPPASLSKLVDVDEPQPALACAENASNVPSRSGSVDSTSAPPAKDHFGVVNSNKAKLNDQRAAADEQKKRLQDRQAKAIERRKHLNEKAQAAKMPKEQPVYPSKPPARPSKVLNPKTAAVEHAQAAPLTPETQKSYKLPLPKTRSPIVALAEAAGGPRDATTAATPESLPEIRSEEDTNTLRKKNVPAWAKTPALVSALATQHGGIRPEDIFGDVQPVKLEDFFKGKKFGRSSTSGWNHHY